MTTINKIAQWSKDKPIWWQHSLRLTLMHGKLDSEDLNEILKIAKMEHGLEKKNDNYPYCSSDLDFTGYFPEQHKVFLHSISDIQGVALLAENQTLEFSNENLIIIYGENGTGKSSYTNILKHCCLTRGDQPEIIGNAFNKNNPIPQAKISVICNEKKIQYFWNPEKPSIDILKSIRVFDSLSAHHYINKEDELGFKPIGLNLLSELSKAVNHVKLNMEEDNMANNGLINLPELTSCSVTAEFITKLSANTNEDDINLHIASVEELQRIEPLKKEIIQSKSQTVKIKKEELQQNIRILTPLKKICEDILNLLSDEAFENLKKQYVDKIKKETFAENMRQQTLKGLPLESIGGLNWLSLWQEAKNFIVKETKKKIFPLKKEEYCPLCLQEIDERSEKRMANLDKYLNAQAAKEAKKAKDLFDQNINELSNISLSLNSYEAALNLLNLHQDNLDKKFKKLFSKLEERKKLFSTSNLPEKIEKLDLKCIDELKYIFTNIEMQIESLYSDEDLLKLINKKELELSHLEDKKYVQENKENIISNIRRYKRIRMQDKILSECNTKSISDISSTINQSNVVQPLMDAFKNELSEFGFNRFNVEVDSRNKRGNQQFKISISNSKISTVAKIASEGEQRCIAIACFLAEMKADSRKSAVIFDDPVNSLSHGWSKRVAKRLVDESKERQVIIFTHSLTFCKLLLESAESKDIKHSNFTFERSFRDAGIIRCHAPWPALTTGGRIKALRKKLENIKKRSKNNTINQIHNECYNFYGYLRESWERLVEEKLLNKVVTRFERGIQTNRLSKLTDICQDDIDKINKAMKKCSTYLRGHDSATAIGEPYISIEEMEQDLNTIYNFSQELQNSPRCRS
ncbi:AAA family ATPase (plasmid) [Arsenophonus sp. aPb]|uniref:AAA family ATPase n=1 Tax=Arsenophonus sp. aPb TaxID=3041619 RepID=UPI0024687C6E|nr:AAA family ATPase [Arsenophonus sp. aPb]WGL99932.1 AAA family ATPase [Arsenophonus sp. aPb]